MTQDCYRHLTSALSSQHTSAAPWCAAQKCPRRTQAAQPERNSTSRAFQYSKLPQSAQTACRATPRMQQLFEIPQLQVSFVSVDFSTFRLQKHLCLCCVSREVKNTNRLNVADRKRGTFFTFITAVTCPKQTLTITRIWSITYFHQMKTVWLEFTSAARRAWLTPLRTAIINIRIPTTSNLLPHWNPNHSKSSEQD